MAATAPLLSFQIMFFSVVFIAGLNVGVQGNSLLARTSERRCYGLLGDRVDCGVRSSLVLNSLGKPLAFLSSRQGPCCSYTHLTRRWPRSLGLSDHSSLSSNSNNVSNKAPSDSGLKKDREFFISEALFVHLGPAGRILTEEFYSHRTNFITFQIEKLKTVLSLESTFPSRDKSVRGNDDEQNPFSYQSMRQMFVACRAIDGKVIGFAEVDANPINDNLRPSVKSQGSQRIDETKEYTAKEYEPCDIDGETGPREENGANSIPRPYMYNLAVDKNWKRKGIATALVQACEEFVRNILTNSNAGIDSIPILYLRVRTCNHAAISLYESLGYEEIDPLSISMTKEDVNSGSSEDGELTLLAKDLSIAVASQPR